MRRMWLVLAILMLGIASLVQAQGYDVEDGGDVEVGDVIEGEIESGQRVQYTLEIEEDDTINIYLDGVDGLDTYLRIYEAEDDDPFAENDDRGDGSFSSAVRELDVFEGDELVVEVGTYTDSGEGEYVLTIVQPAEAQDEGEIEIGDSVDGELEFNVRVSYTLEVDGGTFLSIVTDSRDDIDTVLRLYRDGDDQASAFNDNPDSSTGFAAFENLYVAEDTTLIIEVASYADSQEGEFTLEVEESSPDAPPMEEAQPLDGRDADEVCEDAEVISNPDYIQYLEADWMLDNNTDYLAVFCTEEGAILADLYEDVAPETVNGFVFLALNHFYDDTTFFTINEATAFVGDRTESGWGSGGFQIANEYDEDVVFEEGTLGMWANDIERHGCIFYFAFDNLPYMDGAYTAFGMVIENFDAVQDAREGDSLETVVIVTE
jgi:cyclophilin family peptidyl-prolyl cis-trans isomerase